MNSNKQNQISACCGKIARLSISTRHGRRLFCDLCGKPFVPSPQIVEEKGGCPLRVHPYGLNDKIPLCCMGSCNHILLPDEPNYCPCHIPTDKGEVNYERDYSHTHCWLQEQPSACSIPLEKHTQCCLCDLKYKGEVKEECDK